jgi:hypothetical protein
MDGGMGEALIALALAIGLGVLAALFAIAPATLIVAGFWVAVAGLALGVPTGAVYHVALRGALLDADRLPPRWWLHPTALHDDLPDARRTAVLAWCYAGAAGFLVTIAGCALVAIAAFRGV